MASLLTLPINGRIKLVEDIWDSIAADQTALPITEAQKKELEKRLRAYEDDGIVGREASIVIAEIKNKL